MSEVIQFLSRKNLTALQNLDTFIQHAKEKINVFGADLNFESNTWDITSVLNMRGKRKQKFSLHFGSYPGKSKYSGPIIPFFGDLLNFSKAYLRYSYGINPTAGILQFATPLRALNSVLNGKSITLVNQNDLNIACQHMRQDLSESCAYSSGARLEKIFDFLISKDLIATKFHWKNPNNRNCWNKGRVGKEADTARLKKMPTQAALNAVAEIFRVGIEPRDLFISSIVAIMCSAPERIGEVLELPFDCEINQKEIDGRESYGIRWWPEKGAAPQIKWVVPTMAEVAKEAISKIKNLTREARAIATWYESNPGKIYLPEGYEHLRLKSEISAREVEEIVGIRRGGGPSFIRELLKKSKVNSVNKTTSKSVISFKLFEKVMLEMLPPNFPYLDKLKGIKYSEALFLCKKSEFHDYRPTYKCIIQSIDTNLVNGNLGGKLKHGSRSIFSNHGFTEPDGSPIVVTTHQFRHYLNTLAQHGGMSEVDIAKWSGRVNINQNKVYDHVSSKEMLQIIRESVGSPSKSIGPLATLKNTSLIKRDEFERLVIPTAHITDIGFCIHDYTMSPCEIHRDCLNCLEMVCVKGDKVAEKNIKIAFDESYGLLRKAELSKLDGNYGSDRWFEHHLAHHERLSQLVNILNDETILDGTVIQLDRPKSIIGESKKVIRSKSD